MLSPGPRSRMLTALLTLLGLTALPGCSYVLFLGYLIGGPPSIEPEFDKQTNLSMTDRNVTVAVVCFAPTDVRYLFEDIDTELAKYVTFRLAQHKIKVIEPDLVRAWMDENPDWDRPEEIGDAFKCTYVVYIDLNKFSLYEEGSATLYRGQAEAIVSVWDTKNGTNEKIFSAERISKFPKHNPVSTNEESYLNFRDRYLSRLSDEIGHLFYEYYIGDEMVDQG